MFGKEPHKKQKKRKIGEYKMTDRTYKEIIEKAKQCYNNTKKQNKNGIKDEWSYYISKAIQNPGKPVKKIGVQPAPSPVKLNRINAEINKTEYIKIIKKYTDYVENDEKHRLPNYITINKVKINPTLYTAFVSYILTKYANNKTFPGKQGIKSSIYDAPIKDYLTGEGCSGMGQCTPYYCGCNSLQQAFYRLTGILVPESTIAGWAGTTQDGTDHEGLNTAVAMFNRKYNKNVKIVWYNFNELGATNNARWAKIKSLMATGALFFHLLYRNEYGHYEVPFKIGEDLKILNSLGDRCNYPAYCGYIETRTRAEQESYIAGISQKSVAYLYNG